MEKLANITQADINNGVLNHMLVKAGIHDVQEYVDKFHQQTEELIVDEFANFDPDKPDNYEQIAPPADVQSWITGLRLRLDDPIITPTAEVQQQQQQKQQQQQPPSQPINLASWVQHMAPTNLSASTTTTTTTETTTTSESETTVSGNLGTWLTDWSKSLAEQPPPTSLDTWLQGLVSKNISEPIGKAAHPKGRLNTYLNAAQEVLSQHGYDVSNEVRPPTNVQAQTGMFGNVKQMYFLWKTLDKNNDRKITVEDVQIMLQEMGLGFLSKYVAETLFNMVDSNHDGTLQFHDFIAMMGIIKQLISSVGSVKA